MDRPASAKTWVNVGGAALPPSDRARTGSPVDGSSAPGRNAGMSSTWMTWSDGAGHDDSRSSGCGVAAVVVEATVVEVVDCCGGATTASVVGGDVVAVVSGVTSVTAVGLLGVVAGVM